MKRFSKNEIICPNCGEPTTRPLNISEEQFNNGDWECPTCVAKHEISPSEQRSIERGKKEISKYDPEYEFLVKLVKIVTKEGVPPAEIKALANAYPFETIDDVGDLTAKIWTLATQKYNIPSEWLTKRLPKNASLKTAADLWPAQEQAEDMINHAPGYIAYEYGQDKTSKSKKLNITNIIEILNNSDIKVVRVDSATKTLELTDGSVISFDDAAKRAMDIDKQGNFSGAEFSTTDFNTNPTLDNGPFSSPQDHGATPQKSPFPNTNWLPADDENLDQQPASNVAGALNRPFSKKANPQNRLWVAPDGTEYPVSGIHPVWIKNNMKLLKKYGIKGPSVGEAYEQMKNSGWVRVSNEPSGSGFQIEVQNINQIPSFVDDIVAKYFSPGDTILIGDGQSAGYDVKDPFPSIQKAIRRNASIKEADLSGQTVNTILNEVHANGGVTYNVASGANMKGSQNFAVSIYPDRERTAPALDFDTLEGYLEDNADLLSNANNCFGAWTNGGQIYLDVVTVVPDKDEAIRLAKEHNQIAIWDLQNNQEIPTGGSGGANAKMFSKNSLRKQANSENRMMLNGKPFWSGIVDLADGVIEEVHTYEEAENAGFHHSWYTSPEAQEGMREGVCQFFFMDDTGHILSGSGEELPPEILAKIQQQITVNKNSSKKQAETQALCQEDQDAIAAASSPVYNIAINNYAEAVKRGHEKDRALEYAIESVENLEKIDQKKLVEFINVYL